MKKPTIRNVGTLWLLPKGISAGACVRTDDRSLGAAHIPWVLASRHSLHLHLVHNPRERVEKNPEMTEIKLLQNLAELEFKIEMLKNRAK